MAIQQPAQARLIIGASETNADLYYATRFFAPDPFVYLKTADRSYVMVSDLELDRARCQARVDEVVAQSEWEKKAQRAGLKEPKLLDALELFLKELGVESIQVPGSLAVEYADGLRGRGFDLLVKTGPFFEERLVKTPEEVSEIARILGLAEAALDEAVRAIREARIGQGGVLLGPDGGPLTSEALKRIISRCLLENECVAAHTIVAGGEQAVDPHERGSGPLRAGEPIIIDLFPRCQKTGYWADITRTVIKGTASESQRAMFQAVLEAQEVAFDRIQDGAEGRAIHQAVLDHFDSLGFPTRERQGRMEGFFHGTGHGVGLEIHEPPRIGKVSCTLRTGMVVTVEPGLYYKGRGGMRLEDLVVVEEQGCRNLTAYPKFLEV
jgi:Xaa-Pro aminopeptidase